MVSFLHTAAEVLILMFLIRCIEMYFPGSAVAKGFAFLDG